VIRLTTPDDKTPLLALAKAIKLFEPNQIEELAQMLDRHFRDRTDSQDVWLTDYEDEPVGVAYVAPERMTEGTWNLYLIAIDPAHQKRGRGEVLLGYVEQMLADLGGRLLLIETSGTDDFDYVRKFYRNRGYEEEARIRDFYAEGIDKIVFRKVLKSFADKP
jgi:ribosomal protein S18 acetylase RimI-like enzyme